MLSDSSTIERYVGVPQATLETSNECISIVELHVALHDAETAENLTSAENQTVC